MAGAVDDLFGRNSIALQFLLWGVFQQFFQSLLMPVTRGIENRVNSADPNAPISPADAADMVVRGHLSQPEAEAWAKQSGINPDALNLLIANSGEPPGVMDMLRLYRRGLIAWDGDTLTGPGMAEVVRQSRVRPEWAEAIRAMATEPLSASDAVDAVVSNQIGMEDALRIAKANGITPDDLAILIHTRGRPPGPSEVIEMVRRGLVPAKGVGPDATTLEQAIHESDIKDKWEAVYQDLLEYRPPPRTIVALLRSGSISQDKGLALLRDAGLPADLAAAYVAEASHARLTAARQLARAEILQLYAGHIINRAQATAFLSDLGYNEADAGYELTLQDISRELAAQRAAVTKVGALYMGRHIGQQTAMTSLDALGVAAEQRDGLIRTWTLERDASVQRLSAAEWASAAYYQVVDQATATAGLVALGYTEWDAWAYLSTRAHGPLPNEPQRTSDMPP